MPDGEPEAHKKMYMYKHRANLACHENRVLYGV